MRLNMVNKLTYYAGFNPLNAELYPICHLLALLGVHHIFHISGLRVNKAFSIPACHKQYIARESVILFTYFKAVLLVLYTKVNLRCLR